jgi:membrane protease YdiL (CAAX protease family)
LVSDGTLEAMEWGLLALGVVLGAVLMVRAWRVGLRESFRPTGGPVHRFSVIDALAVYCLWIIAGWACASALGASRDAAGPTTTAATQAAVETSEKVRAAALVNIVGPGAATVFLLILGATRVQGGLRGWGLHVRSVGLDAARALAGYLVVWPVCVALLLLSRALLSWLMPDYVIDEHRSLGYLRLAVSDSPWVAAALVAGSALIAPIVEELLFRGLLQPLIMQATGSPWQGLVITAVLFGVNHHPYWDTVLPMVAFGLVLGWTYARWGSLTAVILMHAMFNSKTLLGLTLGM